MTLLCRMGQVYPGTTDPGWLTRYMDTYYAPLFGGPIMGNRIYLKPIAANTVPGPFGAGSYWETMACIDHQTGWLQARAGRVEQFGWGIAPNNGSNTNGSYPASSAGPFATAAIQAWHTDMANGVYDSLVADIAQCLVRNGMANSHIHHWWEPAYWNWWGAQFDPRWWSNSKRQFQILRDNGFTGRLGPDGDALVHGYIPDRPSTVDAFFYDPYSHGLGASGIPNYMDDFDNGCLRFGVNAEYGEFGVNVEDSDSLGAAFLNGIADRWRANPQVYGQASVTVYTETGAGATTIDFRAGYTQCCAAIANNYNTWNNDLINPGQGGPGSTGGGGGGGTTPGATQVLNADVHSTGSDVTFTGIAGASIVNMAVYRDVLYGTKLFDITPGAGGAFSKTQTGETDGPHNYVLGTFDKPAGWAGSPAALLLSQYNLSVVVDSSLPAAITDRAPIASAATTGGQSLSTAWPTRPGANATVDGDTAILHLAIASGGATPPAPAGFTLLFRDDNGTQVANVFYIRRCNGTESGTITADNSALAPLNFGLNWIDLDIKHGVSAVAVDQHPTAVTTFTGTDVDAPSVTPTKPGDLLKTYIHAVLYAPGVAGAWTAPGGMTKNLDVQQTYSGYRYGLEVAEINALADTSPTGVKTSKWSQTPSYVVATSIAFFAEATTPAQQSITGITHTVDLGHVTISGATVTAGIDTVEVFDGTNLVGAATPNAGSVAVTLADPQSVGPHSYTMYGKKAGVTVTPGYTVDVVVPDAPLVVSVDATPTTATVDVNAVTTDIRIYETPANGGALVQHHAPDATLRWVFTGLSSNHPYNATAYDGTHESDPSPFTTTNPTTVTVVNSVAVSFALVTIDWTGLSLRIYDETRTVVIDEPDPLGGSVGGAGGGGNLPGGSTGSVYRNSFDPGKYWVRVYNDVDPNLATVFDEAPFEILAVPTPPPGSRVLVVTGGKVVIYGGNVVTTQAP
jgi:hypothetical protein